MIDQRLLDRIDDLISTGEDVRRSSPQGSGRPTAARDRVNGPKFWGWQSQVTSFLSRMLGASDTYTVSFIEHTRLSGLFETDVGLSILLSARQDLCDGRLSTLRELVHADLFSDFLEMAEYLMDEDHGYKDAAAVLAGGVLEEHLRQLCQRQTISIEVQTANGTKPKKADTMNADLAAATVYNKNQQKIVTGWLGIRNSAAHAKYGEYTTEQVVSLIGGVRDFIARFPA